MSHGHRDSRQPLYRTSAQEGDCSSAGLSLQNAGSRSTMTVQAGNPCRGSACPGHHRHMLAWTGPSDNILSYWQKGPDSQSL